MASSHHIRHRTDVTGLWSASAIPYPDGDLREKALLATVDVDESLARLGKAAFAATGSEPNIDFALVALTQLPPDALFRLFALGRSVGWAANGVERAAAGNLIPAALICDSWCQIPLR
jgi:citrate synthase